MRKIGKICRMGKEENKGILERGTISVTEKLDGGNSRLCWWEDEDRILFGTKNWEIKHEKDTPKNFADCIKFVKENINEDVLINLHENHGDVVVFGEYMVPHSLEYDQDSTPEWLGYDIWLGDEWATWEFCKEKFEEMNLPHVPEIYYGPAREFEFDDDYELPQSEYRDGLPEGIVIKNEDTGQKGKYRSEEFREVMPNLHPDKHGYEPSDSERLAWQYATEARIKKFIHKYEDEGKEISMEVMPSLWKSVADDIIAEEGDEILLGNYQINTRDFRSEIAQECARVLEAYLSRPEGSVLNERQ